MSSLLLQKLTAEQLSQVIESSPYGKLVIDRDGTIAFVNSSLERTFGYTRPELLGQPVEMLLPERFRAAHPHTRTQYAQAPILRPMGFGRDLMALHRDGHEFPVEIGLNPLTGYDKLYIVAAITDISERKRLEQRLLQVNANLEEFTYVASHDLKSPLRGIADLVTWISEDLPADVPSEIHKNLDRVKLRVQRMETMINELLAYARAGSEAVQLETLPADELIEKIIDFVAPPNGFQINRDVRLPTITVARTPLETVLRNLISNAIRHHDQTHGTVNVVAEARDDGYQFTVSDDGPGIPEHGRNRLFKLFQTLNTPRNGAGAGIGLALSKRLVEAHGGTIALILPQDGTRGACFRFWWPQAENTRHDVGPADEYLAR